MEKEALFDVTIIGGGPAGLYAAFYSGLRGMKTKIIEFQPKLGGKLHIYAEKMIWDVGGHAPITAGQLIDQMIEQAKTFNPSVFVSEKVTEINQDDAGHFILETASGTSHLSKTVIVAAGGGILNPQRLQVDGAEQFEVTNLNYTVPSLAHFAGKTVLISGAGNSAIDWANELERIAKQVYVVCRKDCLSCHEANAEQIMQSSATCLFNTEIKRFIATDSGSFIQEVELANKLTEDVFRIPVDEVLINHGFDRDVSLLEKSPLGIALEEKGIKGTVLGASSVPGIFAAGDVLRHPGKLYLIAGAFQDAANAVNEAKQFIDPEATSTGMVSSHNEIFKSRNQERFRAGKF